MSLLRQSWVLFGVACLLGLASGAEIAGVPVVVQRRSAWHIEARDAGSPAAHFAAAELQRYLLNMTGCRLPLEHGPADGPAFVVGRRKQLSARDAALLPAAATGYDGYAFTITPGRIVVAGDNGRGTL